MTVDYTKIGEQMSSKSAKPQVAEVKIETRNSRNYVKDLKLDDKQKKLRNYKAIKFTAIVLFLIALYFQPIPAIIFVAFFWSNKPFRTLFKSLFMEGGLEKAIKDGTLKTNALDELPPKEREEFERHFAEIKEKQRKDKHEF